MAYKMICLLLVFVCVAHAAVIDHTGTVTDSYSHNTHSPETDHHTAHDDHHPSHDNDTHLGNHSDHHGDHGHHGVHVVGWQFSYVRQPLVIAVFILVAAVSKLRE